MNAIVRIEETRALTAGDMRAHVNLIQEVMQAVMKDKTHYGTIPGTPKPSLWKPGAEVLCTTFRIAPSYRVEDLGGGDFIRYRVTCIGTHQGTGIVLGEGMGECSSMEEKYKWRKAVSKAEFEAAPENMRRVKFGKDYNVNQIRTEPADLANTILKMACKRAQVAMTLNVTGASDIFSQDIEDLPEELREAGEDGAEPKTVKQPERRSAANGSAEPLREGPINEAQAKLLRATLGKKELTEAECCKHFGVETLDVLPFAKLNEAIQWSANPQ